MCLGCKGLRVSPCVLDRGLGVCSGSFLGQCYMQFVSFCRVILSFRCSLFFFPCYFVVDAGLGLQNHGRGFHGR